MRSLTTSSSREPSLTRQDGHHELVASAYRDTCRLLVAFHGLVKRMNPQIEDLGPGVIAAGTAGAPPLLVDDKPRLLIDDRTRKLAFTKNGHLDKLRKKGFHVQMVQSANKMIFEARF